MTVQLHPAGLIDLQRLSGSALERLLEEETAAWREELDWDFGRSADLVRKYVEMRALNGAAVIESGAAVAYGYYVLEDSKALIGDLYVGRARRGTRIEDAILERAFAEIAAVPGIRRAETQLMMTPWDSRPAPAFANLTCFERNFMRLDLTRADLQEGRLRTPCYIDAWSDHYLDGAARVIAAAYDGHIDSSINDQYRSINGARRFLHSIVQYPGCGTFSGPASCCAFEALEGVLCGVSLASLVAPASGHITQICVAPAVHGKGVGYAMLRRSLAALRGMGCRSASLTVTAANKEAVALYERVGFRTIRKFPALVWDR